MPSPNPNPSPFTGQTHELKSGDPIMLEDRNGNLTLVVNYGGQWLVYNIAAKDIHYVPIRNGK